MGNNKSKISTPVSATKIPTPVSETKISISVSESNISTPVSETKISTGVADPEFFTPEASPRLLTPEPNISTPLAGRNILTPLSLLEVSTPLSERKIWTPVATVRRGMRWSMTIDADSVGLQDTRESHASLSPELKEGVEDTKVEKSYEEANMDLASICAGRSDGIMSKRRCVCGEPLNHLGDCDEYLSSSIWDNGAEEISRDVKQNLYSMINAENDDYVSRMTSMEPRRTYCHAATMTDFSSQLDSMATTTQDMTFSGGLETIESFVEDTAASNGPGSFVEDTAASTGPGSFVEDTAASTGPGSFVEDTAASTGPGSFGEDTAASTGPGSFVEDTAALTGPRSFVEDTALSSGPRSFVEDTAWSPGPRSSSATLVETFCETSPEAKALPQYSSTSSSDSLICQKSQETPLAQITAKFSSLSLGLFETSGSSIVVTGQRTKLIAANRTVRSPSVLARRTPTRQLSRKVKFGERAVAAVESSIMNLKRIAASAPKDVEDDIFDQPSLLKLPLLHYQHYALRWMWWREQEMPYGGILADEMGMGKTATVLSLVCFTKEFAETLKLSYNPSKSKNPLQRHSFGTLVVCVPNTLVQWEDEVKKMCPDLKVYKYHGDCRTKSATRLAQYDVVLTTYNILRREITRESSATLCPVRRINWYRVVLDEGHNIKNPKTKCAQAVYQIDSQHRWVVTGTPIHNSLSDLYAVIKFLRLSPWDKREVWNVLIGMKRTEVWTEGNSKYLRLLARSVLLRRTKNDVKVTDGAGVTSEILSLPSKSVLTVCVDLTRDERELYDRLEKFCTQKWQEAMEQRNFREGAPNSATKTNSGYWTLLALITRCRRFSVLPRLGMRKIEEDDSDLSGEFDPKNDEILSRKNPILCANYQSSKLLMVYHDIRTIRKECKLREKRMDKIIIVSQWTSVLEAMDRDLTVMGYSTVRIFGGRTPSEIAKIVKVFNRKKRPQILLLSLIAGGVGLNLTGANHMFIMDVHWNPQLEKQVHDRVHRIGQTKPVYIRRYVTRDTIEERVVQLQDAKLKLADEILQTGYASDLGTGLKLNDLQKLLKRC